MHEVTVAIISCNTSYVYVCSICIPKCINKRLSDKNEKLPGMIHGLFVLLVSRHTAACWEMSQFPVTKKGVLFTGRLSTARFFLAANLFDKQTPVHLLH